MTNPIIKSAVRTRLGFVRWARHPRRDEHGSVTMEHILWAIAVIVIVGIAVAAIKGYVDHNSSLIK